MKEVKTKSNGKKVKDKTGGSESFDGLIKVPDNIHLLHALVFKGILFDNDEHFLRSSGGLWSVDFPIFNRTPNLYLQRINPPDIQVDDIIFMGGRAVEMLQMYNVLQLYIICLSKNGDIIDGIGVWDDEIQVIRHKINVNDGNHSIYKVIQKK